MNAMARMPVLDALRGFSILLVILGHTAPIIDDYFTVLQNGPYGVTLFFILSGFVITYTQFQRKDAPRTFYLRRVARLLPMMLMAIGFSLTAVYACNPKHPGYPDIILFPTQEHWIIPVALATFSMNWFLIVFNAKYRTFGHTWDIYWSLAIEEQFYVFYPWVLRLVKWDPGELKKLLALLIFMGPVTRISSSYIFDEIDYIGMLGNSFACFEQIAMGAWLALWWMERPRDPVPLWQLLPGIVLWGWAFGWAPVGSVFGRTWGPTVLAVGAILVLRVGLSHHACQHAVWRPLRLLGEISYSAYLIHQLVLYGLWDTIIPLPRPLAYAAVLLVTMLFSWVTYRLIEKPCQELILKLARTSQGAIPLKESGTTP